MKERIANFMRGRYGGDGFNKFISTVALVLCVFGFLLDGWLLTVWSIGLLAFAYYRMLSKKMTRRAQENAAYYHVRRLATQSIATKLQRLRAKAAQRKTHRVFRCPQCRQELRVPKGRGKIEIDCPKCHKNFMRKS